MARNISIFQIDILEEMRIGHVLQNTYESETAPYRPANGMFSGRIETNSRAITVPYRTIEAMLLSELIEVEFRATHTGFWGETPFESTRIVYKLTERGREIAAEAAEIRARLVRTGQITTKVP